MPYLGNEPAAAFTSTTKDSFSGDASTTDFTMSKSANVNAVRVVVENVVQNPTVAYTCTGTTLSFTSAPPTGTNNIYVVHLGPPAATVAPPTTINNNTTFTGGVSLKNETPEDTDGGRESKVTFKGLQSGQEESTLAEIQASHDGTSDDEKGDLIFRTNDGSDGSSPTEAMRIQSDQKIGVGLSSNISSQLHVNSEVSLGPDNNNRMILGSTAAGVGSIGTIEAGTASFSTATFKGGKIGVGVADPTAPLTVKSPTNAEAIHVVGRSDDIGQMKFFEADHTTILSTLEARNSFVNFGSVANIPTQFMTNNTERMRIDENGTVLVGATSRLSSSSTLELHGNANYFVQRNTGASAGQYWRYEVDTNNTLYILDNGSTGVYIPDGNTSWSSLSDETLKENITDVGDVLDKVKNYRTSRFNWVGGQEDDTRIGFIAQDWATDFPEVVSQGKDNKLGLNYTETIPILLKAIQELSAKVDALETENTAIKARLDALEAE